MNYITKKIALEKHNEIIRKGGMPGIYNIGQLESILENIQNDLYYPEFEDKLTHLFFGICKFHCFVDGNKRTTLALCDLFLLMNGYTLPNFMRNMENIALYVAEGKISKELLRELLFAYTHYQFESEEVKLKIIDALS